MGVSNVGDLLKDPGWRQVAADADGRRHDTHGLDYASLTPQPPKIICVGLNYRTHILESGSPIPKHPTLFAKFAPALVGAFDDIELSVAASQWDWEAELGLVIGSVAHRLDETEAASAIAGYTVVNDITARDWQMRTREWLQGKTFARTTPIGPHLVTVDEAGTTHGIRCSVNGELMQKADTGDLVFGPAALVSYISTILPLQPGDVIATGTPGGVGLSQTPPRFLSDGDEVITWIEGVGECRNTCRTP
ncbi:acylpyruvate hydrolase [Prauserella aidingensis]|nr:acylpyruvate hydrolase [Prauserella aidingensis]